MAPKKLSITDVRTIAARLLDDMCANMQMIKSFSDEDVHEVAISLGEMLADEGLADEWSFERGARTDAGSKQP